MRRQLALWGTLAAVLLLCERGLTSCLGAAPCLGSAAGPQKWLAMGLGASAVLLAALGLAAAVRSVWLLVTSSGTARRLARIEVPTDLANLAGDLGIRRLQFLAADQPLAFCTGAVRPVVYLSRGARARLDPMQLQAVLLHEFDHAASREPLRRAAVRAAREVAFFLPVLGWLDDRRVERSELQADRRAMDRLGPRPVAGALWALGSEPGSAAAPAFAGTAQLRVAQLLGDPVPRRRLQPSMLAASFMGAVFAVAIVSCVAEIVALSLR